MVFELEISSRANFEIYESVSWYELQQPFLGERFLDDFYQNLERIKSNPYQFQLRQNFRHVVLDNFPFVIIYQVESNLILILSVFDTRKNPLKKP